MTCGLAWDLHFSCHCAACHVTVNSLAVVFYDGSLPHMRREGLPRGAARRACAECCNAHAIATVGHGTGMTMTQEPPPGTRLAPRMQSRVERAPQNISPTTYMHNTGPRPALRHQDDNPIPTHAAQRGCSDG